jgi:EF hand domain-containing protein
MMIGNFQQFWGGSTIFARCLMARQSNIVCVICLFAGLAATGVRSSRAVAQTTANVPKPQDKLVLGENEVKQLLLLMDTNQNGKISKQEYLHFMEAEFDRLDTNHNGELDPKELTQSKLRASRNFTAVGK